MPYVKGGNNDEIFKWKGSETAKINHELKYPYGKIIIIIPIYTTSVTFYSCSCNS